QVPLSLTSLSPAPAAGARRDHGESGDSDPLGAPHGRAPDPDLACAVILGSPEPGAGDGRDADQSGAQEQGEVADGLLLAPVWRSGRTRLPLRGLPGRSSGAGGARELLRGVGHRWVYGL